MKAIKWLDEHLEEVLLVILLVLITCVEMIQVIIRNIPWIPALTWAEEFCRFCWIWSVFISLPYTLRKGSMLRVNVLMDLLPSVLHNAVNILVDLINAAVMALLGYHSITVISSIMISAEASPAMLWPMWMVYSVMVFGFFFGAYITISAIMALPSSFHSDSIPTFRKSGFWNGKKNRGIPARPCSQTGYQALCKIMQSELI